jgi:hypothetical protein
VTDQPEQDTCGAIGNLDGPLPGSTGRCYRRPHHDPHHRDQNGHQWDAPACGEECAEGHTYTGRCAQATPGAPRPDDADWNSPEDAIYDGPSPFLPRIRQACVNAEDVTHRFAEVGMDPARLRAIINGDLRPNTLDMALIATACRTTVDWLLGGDPPRNPEVRIGCDLGCDHGDPCADCQPDNARTTPDNPAASNNETDNPLREQYAAAMREHYLITNRDEADADGNMPCRCGDWREGGDADEYDWDHHLAEAVLAVRDRHMEQLLAEVDHMKHLVAASSEPGHAVRMAAANARRAETAEAKLAAVRQLLAEPRSLIDRTRLLDALDGPADATPPAEDPAVDTCRLVQVGGETIRIHGSRPLTGLEMGYAAEVVAAARRKLAAEPPVVRADNGTESALTRRIRAQQRGASAAAEAHRYLSTGCLHGEHGYCQANTGSNGTKIPATCKFCATPCTCPCHQQPTTTKEN